MWNKVLLFLSCTLAVFGDMIMVWWAKHSSHPIWAMLTGIALMIISTSIWMYTMKNGIESAIAITIYALFTVTGCSILGYYIFHEHLSTINFIGLIISAIALILISY